MALADPTPAQLPLPGGRDGATVRVHPINTGHMQMPLAWLHREEGRLGTLRAYGFGGDSLKIPMPCFLVEHPGAGPILIDTGMHESVAVEPRKNLGRMMTRFAGGLEMAQGQGVPSQLRERNLEPADIGLVVMTHLHFDHASGLSEFADSTIIVNTAEWEAANAPRGILNGYVKSHFDHGFDYRSIDFSASDSFATFGSSIDLLGDGSMRLVSTPGHTLGHMSVVLRLKDRELLVAGDAIYNLPTLHGEPLPAVTADEHLFRRSLRELQIYEKETPEAVIVPGHDLAAWEALDPLYE